MTVPDTGEELIENGFSIILTREKIPIEKFGNRPPMTQEELRRRYRKGMNLAIRLPGLVALDADDERARERLHTLNESPIMQETPRGGEHRVYRLPEGITLGCRQRLFGCGFDLKTGANSYLMFSPSQVRGRSYRLIGEIVPPIELPEFNIEWLPRREQQPRPPPSSLVSRNRLAVRKWIAHVFSVSGAGGHKQCYRAACKLADAGLSWDEAWEELCLWNMTNAEPPWSEKELHHKLTDAFRRKR